MSSTGPLAYLSDDLESRSSTTLASTNPMTDLYDRLASHPQSTSQPMDGRGTETRVLAETSDSDLLLTIGATTGLPAR